MPYVFDGYSEASSARNSPEHQGQPPAGSRQRRRERDGSVGGGGGGSEGMYFGTGRFYEENLRNEEQRRRERERRQTPRHWSSTGHFDGGLDGSEFATGGAWSEERGPAFVEALRRARERWQGRSGGHWTAGLGMGGGAPPPHGFGDGEETRFDDLFGGMFGAAGGGGHGDDGEGEMFGARAGGSSGFGFFGGGGATNFEGTFGSSGDLHDRAQYGAGAGTHFGFGGQEDVQRGGAGMTWAEFTELFRHRYDGGSSYGYAGGRLPAHLFDSWHTDW
ncbi:hypothetical protein LZ31DRAFT_89389 [Colletotrichum somersetense]|nr:hypothetical protein LZ31DRAFT_89389 [Colletotrichum somersetense]